ncbi:putative anthocyanidin reductase isoform X2 [Andrographis paniculata]|uniref:putative anthocyanidin reductase isoform X2 n=1 Tax=Andrographis paniculata TaxID=175694 RepID=UPI0021E7603B|nr:putative anthocyanidin reductase isoform X2 [Andrographis paniculata]
MKEGNIERSILGETHKMGNGKTYCVTGATGYIGSWLVKSLLQRGCTVHATLRNPEKASHFVSLWQGEDRLRLFTADLQEDGSFDDAVRGCHGVFHVAAPMESIRVPASADAENYVKTEVVDPAVRGALNILKACLKSDTRRVVFTSSISTMSAKDSSGRWLPIVDEHCQIPIHDVLKAKANGWLSSEDAAFEFAEENGIDLVSVITATVGGPFLTPTVPTSIQFLLAPVTGSPTLFPLLEAVNSRMGSIAMVHIEDVCNAHVFLMERTCAKGRYLCCVESCSMYRLVELLKAESSFPVALRLEQDSSSPVEISSKKIRDLGFEFKYSCQDIVKQTLDKCLEFGFLPHSRE